MPKIRALQLTQKNLAAVGIDENLLVHPYPLNEKVSLGFLTIISSLLCNLMFTVREAETFTEYTQSIYMSSFAVMIMIALVIVLLNFAKLMSLRDGFECLANTSA